ncbi:MAG: hypothetical protein RLZZ126_2046 [Pseudomonadota bacterium]|jgi:thiosulfate/3-mercaptopyruvate sulfurtransferase
MSTSPDALPVYRDLIQVDELAALMASGRPFMVFDCSFDLMNPAAGEAAFAQGHIPGAVYVHLDRDLSEKSGRPDEAASGGRHPLPTRPNFAAWLGDVGFGNDMQAVVYDRQGCNYCGRLWWMLKWLGHDAVAVLDGGLQAWSAAHPVEKLDATKIQKKIFKISDNQYRQSATEDIAKNIGKLSQTVIDARATPRFKGEVEPLDPVAGHIPGALNRPFSLNLGADGKFKPAAQLRQEFEQLLGGRDPAGVVHHCGSGVSAVPNVLAMAIAGYGPTALYAGSWSEWCADPSRPVAQG